MLEGCYVIELCHGDGCLMQSKPSVKVSWWCYGGKCIGYRPIQPPVSAGVCREPAVPSLSFPVQLRPACARARQYMESLEQSLA